MKIFITIMLLLGFSYGFNDFIHKKSKIVNDKINIIIYIVTTILAIIYTWSL